MDVRSKFPVWEGWCERISAQKKEPPQGGVGKRDGSRGDPFAGGGAQHRTGIIRGVEAWAGEILMMDDYTLPACLSTPPRHPIIKRPLKTSILLYGFFLTDGSRLPAA